MNAKCEAEIELEQRERPEEGSLRGLPVEPPASAPDKTATRGRPWPKGQSGNPAECPLRIHPPAAVTEYVIARKTIPLAKKLRHLALAGDRLDAAALVSACHVNPARRAGLAHAGAGRGPVGTLREAVAAAAGKGAITPRQADALMRLVNSVIGSKDVPSPRANASAAAPVQTNRAGTFATPFRPGASATVGDSRRGWVATQVSRRSREMPSAIRQYSRDRRTNCSRMLERLSFSAIWRRRAASSR